MEQQNQHKHSHHHILPNKMIFTVGGLLLLLTIITVAIAKVDLGSLNFIVAMAVATVKGSLVAMIFMALWYDKRENGVIFFTSFLFLAIFIVLSATDLFFRGDVYVKGPLISQAKSKLKNPWIATPELISHGKELFQVQCVSCHGAEGKGNGPAASALNPHPRNFTVTDGWKNGRTVAGVWKTLKEGVPGSAMASFGTMPGDDRWALAHYVLSLNSTAVAKSSPEDLKKVGVDTAGGGEAEEKVIPVEVAMERLAVASQEGTHLYRGNLASGSGEGARIYNAQCVQCHGAEGRGGIKVKSMGVWPNVFVTTRPFKSYSSLNSTDAFNRTVIRGIPGELMPGNGQLSGGELRDLYQFVKSL